MGSRFILPLLSSPAQPSTDELTIQSVKITLTKIVPQPLTSFERCLRIMSYGALVPFINVIKDYVLQFYGFLIDYSSSKMMV